jgi:hypothetical protein
LTFAVTGKRRAAASLRSYFKIQQFRERNNVIKQLVVNFADGLFGLRVTAKVELWKTPAVALHYTLERFQTFTEFRILTVSPP